MDEVVQLYGLYHFFFYIFLSINIRGMYVFYEVKEDYRNGILFYTGKK